MTFPHRKRCLNCSRSEGFDKLLNLDYVEVRDNKGGIRYERRQKTSEKELQTHSEEIQERSNAIRSGEREKPVQSPEEREVTPPAPQPDKQAEAPGERLAEDLVGTSDAETYY